MYSSRDSSITLINPLYTGRYVHNYMYTSPFFVLEVSGLFYRFYSIYDGQFCLQTIHSLSRTAKETRKTIYFNIF